MQLLTVAFEDGADVEARIVEEVGALQGRGVLRLLDLLVLRKDDDGSISRWLLADHELGDLLSGVAPPEPAALFALVAGDESGTRALAESLAPGGLLVFLLVEHRWARPLFEELPPGVCPLGLPVLVERREWARRRLLAAGVNVRAYWERLPAGVTRTVFPAAHDVAERILVLPVHQSLTDQQIEHLLLTLKRLDAD